MLTSAQRMQPAVEAGVSLGAPAASNPFPLNNFKHFLTLFSKFFSSFPHGTCSLSVSRRYLALDGIYHLLWAAFPNNPTLRKRLVERLQPRRRGSHPLRRPFPGDLGAAGRRGRLSRLQFAYAEQGDFQVGLFPVRSPLLGESWLVSFPPLIDMLKFSGCSCLNSGRMFGCESPAGSGTAGLAEPTAACDYWNSRLPDCCPFVSEGPCSGLCASADPSLRDRDGQVRSLPSNERER